MVTHFRSTIKVNKGKLGHANNGEHKDKKHEEESERGHGGGGFNQCNKDSLQLLLLLDKSEYTTNSECTQNGAKNLKVFTNAAPGQAKDDDCANHDAEIEQIPAILEIERLLSNNLQDGFDGEDDDKGVVKDLKHILDLLWLHVPVETKYKGVGKDTDHDEQVKGFVLSYDDARVTDFAVALSLELYFGLHVVSHELHLNPTKLRSCQRAVAGHKLFLIVECLNDHTDEEFNEKHADADNENHRVNNHDWVVVFNG